MPDDDITTSPAPARAFGQFLEEQRNGVLLGELDGALAELIEAVREHGKAGKLVLTVQVKPHAKGGSSTVFVSDDVKVAKPAGERPETIFFVTGDNRLSRHDPRQTTLPLREVTPTEPTPLREVK